MNTTFQLNPTSQTITVKRGERQQFVFITTKGLASGAAANNEKIKLNFDLKGQDCDFEAIGLVLGHGEELYPFDITINHQAPKTTGRVWLKSVLNGEAKQEVKAMINIPRGAAGADSYLSHRTLVLSEKARTKTIPSLEILEDDVKASHGATVGKIDQEQMFYLHSRGLRENDARKIIVDGFLEDLVAKIQDKGVQKKVHDYAADLHLSARVEQPVEQPAQQAKPN